MIEQPAASAGAIFFTTCDMGKFQGVKAATGPTGSRMTAWLTPVTRAGMRRP